MNYGLHNHDLNVALDMLMGRIFKLVTVKNQESSHKNSHCQICFCFCLFLITMRYYHRMSQVWFSEKQTLRLSLVGRILFRECTYDQHLWKGRNQGELSERGKPNDTLG